jgi:carboxypeptidase family protein
MRKLAVGSVLVLAMAFGASRAHAEAGALAGRIKSGNDHDVSSARVYAYQVADTSLRRVTTDEDGRFRFESLPAGVYKIIAHKIGFLPVIVMLTRASAEAHQFLEMQLRTAPAGSGGGAADFWALREEVPPDVLRELESPAVVELTAVEAPATTRGAFHTEVEAMTGVDTLSESGETLMTSGRVGVRGQVGSMRVGLRGDFSQLDGTPAGAAFVRDEVTSGQTSSLQLRLDGPSENSFNLTSLNNRMVAVTSGKPIEFEHYRVSWSRPVGLSGRSTFLAQYTDESNFYRWGYFNNVALPDASRTLRVEGDYSTAWGERTSFETGLRYRQRETDYLRAGALSTPLLGVPPTDTIGAFGKGSYEATPAVVVEYGLYTELSDGAVSFVPRGGFILSLGPLWQAEGTFSHRIEGSEAPGQVDFVPTYFAEPETMEQAEEYRYQLVLSRPFGDGGSLSFGALDRRFAESLRFYFSNRFIDHYENLFLVPGDRLPELQLSVSKQIGSSIQTRIGTNVAQGGGGVIVAGGGRPYENEVSYLVTSVDTQYTPTSTGVFLSFQHLTQQLTPFNAAREPRMMDLESLELMLTQDLGALLDLAADWAVQVSMEVSRGTLPNEGIDRDDIRRRVLGGVAVRF